MNRTDLKRLREAEDSLTPEQRYEAIYKRYNTEKREGLIKSLFGKQVKPQKTSAVPAAETKTLSSAELFEQQIEGLIGSFAGKKVKGAAIPPVVASDSRKAYRRGSALVALLSLMTVGALGTVWISAPDVITIFRLLPTNQEKRQQEQLKSEPGRIKQLLSGKLVNSRKIRVSGCSITDIKRFRFRHPVSGLARWHNGIDIVCPKMPHPIYAPFDGTLRVLRPANSGGGGLVLRITSPDGWMVQIMHAHSSIKPGRVKAGQKIGMGGATTQPNMGKATGPHSHIEIARLEGTRRRYLTPSVRLVEAILGGR